MTLTRHTRQFLTLHTVILVGIFLSLVTPQTALGSTLRSMPSANNVIPFYDCFKDSAAAYEIDQNLLIAIAIVESSLDPNAISKANALGLMQIKWPQTAEHLGIGNRSLLFNPCINIKTGARYLSEVRQPYKSLDQRSSTNMMLAAYRIGPNAVKGLTKMPSIVEDYIYKVRREKSKLDDSNTYLARRTSCVLEEFKKISLNTHDPNLRTQKTIDWVKRNQKQCKTTTWEKLLINLPNWLGTVYHNIEVQSLIYSTR